MEDGSRSGCNSNVTEAECNDLCEAGNWDNHYYIDIADCACEGPEGNLPVGYELDVDDLDGDGDTEETIRWRYVVVIDSCRVVGDECQERHWLYRCWKDDEHD